MVEAALKSVALPESGRPVIYRRMSDIGSRLCENLREPRTCIIVSRQKLPVQLVSASTKLRHMFYTQIERRTFHTET
jgi:hypothetical protein